MPLRGPSFQLADELIQAIQQRETVKFDYDGMTRLVEPHVYGCTKDGREYLRGYQVSGLSSSDRQPPWRLFLLEKIKNFSRSGVHFRTARGGYRVADPAIRDVFAQY